MIAVSEHVTYAAVYHNDHPLIGYHRQGAKNVFSVRPHVLEWLNQHVGEGCFKRMGSPRSVNFLKDDRLRWRWDFDCVDTVNDAITFEFKDAADAVLFKLTWMHT